ncbi:hypothetical protein [Paraburkholderia sp. BCC1885]|uniref:hypothetical protein n=1 Tax=Paraburkholderia sp. BCC1885 TaxID=2562669 RepID=UPI00118433F1|nr:hypothetical protein [Paraburkholderia sp. BCC1885]
MFVDPRVAQGRAKFDLNHSPQMFAEERRSKIQDIIVRSLKEYHGERNRRGFMRLLERQVVPRLRHLGLDPYLGMLGQVEGMFCNFTTMSSDIGLREFQLSLTVPDLVFKSFASTLIGTHAVGRCMQRNGVMSLDEIEGETSTAFVLARVLRPLAMVEKWKQVGIPTAKGLFVGEMTNSDDVWLRTYIRPAIGGRPSRWGGFAALFSTMPSWSAAQIAGGSDLTQWMINHILALRTREPLCERCPFLLDPYEHVDDPLDAIWQAARASADDEAN